MLEPTRTRTLPVDPRVPLSQYPLDRGEMPTTKERKQRRDILSNLIAQAKDVPCADCGKKYPSYVMDFDHVIGEKKYRISQARSRYHKIETVQKEIDKCDVVCSNCHRERTHNRRTSVAQLDRASAFEAQG